MPTSFFLNIFQIFEVYNPGVELLGQLVSLFNHLKNHQTISHSSCSILHSQQYRVRVPISPHPRQYLVIFPLFIFIMAIRFTWCQVVSHCEPVLSYNTFNFRLKKKTYLPLNFSFMHYFSFWITFGKIANTKS